MNAMKLPRAQHFYNSSMKRFSDLVLACILTILVSPVILVISILVKLDSKGPVFYRGERAGRFGKPFLIYKFRSMVLDADKIGGGTTALNDSRITRIGKWLRKTKMDEIPQLFNIIKGEMSFIGPRPELLKYTNMYDEEESLILCVRPGITDISSIQFIALDELVGPGNADQAYEELVLKHKNQLRIEYVRRQSWMLDANLFVKTVIKVLGKTARTITKKDSGKYGVHNTEKL